MSWKKMDVFRRRWYGVWTNEIRLHRCTLLRTIEVVCRRYTTLLFVPRVGLWPGDFRSWLRTRLLQKLPERFFTEEETHYRWLVLVCRWLRNVLVMCIACSRATSVPKYCASWKASNFAELPQKHRSAAVSAPISAFFNQHPASTALKKSAHASSLPLKPISDANAPLTPSSQPRQPLPSSSIRKTRHDNDDRNISRFYRRSEHDSDGDGKSEGSGAKIKGLFQCSECRRYVPNEQHQVCLSHVVVQFVVGCFSNATQYTVIIPPHWCQST